MSTRDKVARWLHDKSFQWDSEWVPFDDLGEGARAFWFKEADELLTLLGEQEPVRWKVWCDECGWSGWGDWEHESPPAICQNCETQLPKAHLRNLFDSTPPTQDRNRGALRRIEQELTDLCHHDEMGGTARYLLSVLHGNTETMRECAEIPADAILASQEADDG